MKTLIAVIFILFNTQCFADDGDYLLGGVGINESNVNPEFDISNTSKEYDNFSLRGFIGHRFNNNTQLELGYGLHQDIDFLGIADSIKVSEFMVLTGYRFSISEDIKIIPRIGISRWRIESKEGWLFNSGPEKQFSESGSNSIFLLSTVISNFYITYQSTNYDYGSFNSLIIGVEIGL